MRVPTFFSAVTVSLISALVFTAQANTTEMNNCDKLAAFSDDPQGVAKGVPWDSLVADTAIEACEDANTKYPEEPRFLFLLGRALLKAEKYLEAFSTLKRAEDQGHSAASHLIGFMYEHGWGVKKDAKRAAELYRKAADAGLPLAQYALGKLFMTGAGVEKDYELAATWFRKAAEQGSKVAQFNLGSLYAKGNGVPKDLSRAFEWFRKAAEQGHLRSQFNLGLMHKTGQGVSVDYDRAVTWYRKAADQGLAIAEFDLGFMYDQGLGVSKDLVEAATWYRKAAEKGLADAQFNLAIMLEEGEGVPKNEALAVEWYRKAVVQGFVDAQYNLAVMLEEGKGGSKNLQEAFKLYQLDAEKGHIRSREKVGTLLIEGKGVSKDAEKGLTILRAVAEEGDRFTQWLLGNYFATGEHISKDLKKAAKWYRRAAEQGDHLSMSRLGRMYIDGNGVEKDIDAGLKFMLRAANSGKSSHQSSLAAALQGLGRVDEALPWFRKAAKQNYLYAQGLLGSELIKPERNADEIEEGKSWLTKAAEAGYQYAQYSVGRAFEQGRFGDPDFEEAVRWYRKASDQGYMVAQNRLGYFYWNGQGVTKDLKKAIQLFRLSAKQGDTNSKYMLGYAYQTGLGVLKNFKKAEEIFQESADKDDPMALIALAEIKTSGGGAVSNYRLAEVLLRKAIAIIDTSPGATNRQKAHVLNYAGLFNSVRGRYAEGEGYYKRALEISRSVDGELSTEFADILDGYASLLQQSGRYEEADKLFKRAIEILENLPGSHRGEIALIRYNHALLKEAIGDQDEAANLFRKIEGVLTFAFGAETKRIEALIAGNLGRIYINQGKLDEAGHQFERAFSKLEGVSSLNEPHYLRIRGDYAEYLTRRGRYEEAEATFVAVISALERQGLKDHPLVLAGAAGFIEALQANGKTQAAIDQTRQLIRVYATRLNRQSREALSQLSSERRIFRRSLTRHIGLLVAPSVEVSPAELDQHRALSFELLQLVRSMSAADAIANMGARYARGDDALAKLVRSRQDAVNKWRGLDRTMMSGTASGARKFDSALIVAESRKLEGEIKEIDKKLLGDFPEYYQLTSSSPLPIKDLQKLLGKDEALLAFLVGDKESFAWLIRRDFNTVKRISINEEEMSEAVQELREGLDPETIYNITDVPVFDRTLAYRLYMKLFQPFEKHLQDVRHLIVVPDGALQSLPLGVLVTDKPQKEITDFAGYRQVPWLAKRFALTVMPSVASLRALRRFASKVRANKPFIGFGNPVLKGHPGFRGETRLAALFKPRGKGLADPKQVKQLGALPDTADELRALAKSLKAGPKSVYLADKATEKMLKSLDLSNTRVVAFATHGLMAGDFQGLGEPALVMTPPDEASELDDGLLTASEIARLNLNADLVILSACNTAAPNGTPGAEGLSGLAKAFFFAGSRALLVSHWAVFSNAAVKLTTRMLDIAVRNPNIGHAEALRRSMLALMKDREKPFYAHPMFWAPFVVVGEGGRPTVN